MKGTKIPTKDHDEELLNINIFAPQCKNINIDLGASNPSLGNVNININLNVHAANDVNQGESPKGSSDEKSYINVKEIPKYRSSLDIEIFSPQKGRVIFD